jgi:hypothetical protein
MKRYEYIRLVFTFDDLRQLNRLASTGFRVVSVQPDEQCFIALMERELPVNA